ncbi:MAG TPA: FAD-dependent oxidoreductase, partial [Microbacteriaceae bacterium]|nr:FAD-dependent oxidoreductase [Microbacteriaceae bacterium]
MSEALERALNEPDTRVVIIGGGVAGLVAARECARPGFLVTVLEASDRLGGSVGRLNVGGVTVDSGAESFATRGGHVAELIDELGLTDQIVQPLSAGAWLQLRDKAVPIPKGGLLGIPSSPLARDVVAALGWKDALRAYADRLMPVMKIGHEHNFGALVRRRMGQAVLDKLVAPVTTGVYSAAPDDLEVDAAAPRLNQLLTQLGSLSGAVTELRAAAKPGSAALGLRGGMARLIDALEADARARGAEIRTGSAVAGLHEWEPVTELGPTPPVTELVEVEPVTELVEVTPDVASTSSATERPARWRVVLADGQTLSADIVLIATPAAAALELLRTAAPSTAGLADLDWPQGSPVELATLVVRAPALNAAPRGTGLLVADEAPFEAKALTHSTAKWSWLAESTGPDMHVVRLSYGRVGSESPAHALDDDEFRALATREAAGLLNIPLQASDVLGFARTRWINAVPH